MNMLWVVIVSVFVFVGCSSLHLRVNPQYEISDAQMFLKGTSGDNSVGSGISFGPGFELYYEEYGVMGIGSLGLAGVSSLDDAARLTAAPLFSPVSFFNNAINPSIGYRFAAEGELLYGLVVSIDKLFRKRLKLE